MKSIFHDDEFYRPHLVSFITDLPAMYSGMKSEFLAGQYKNAKQTSHRIAGAAATFGFPDLAHHFHDMEHLLESDTIDIPKIGEIMEVVERDIQSLDTEGLV